MWGGTSKCGWDGVSLSEDGAAGLGQWWCSGSVVGAGGWCGVTVAGSWGCGAAVVQWKGLVGGVGGVLEQDWSRVCEVGVRVGHVEWGLVE